MANGRAQIDSGGNNVRYQGPGDGVMEMTQLSPVTTVGNGVVTATAYGTGCIERTGPTGGFIDTFDSADNLMATNPPYSPGDSFEVLYRNTVGFAMTAAAGEGVVLVGTNLGVTASSVRKYLITVLASARRQVFQANTTNANNTLTGLSQAQVQTLMPGMGVTGTGVPGSTNVLAVNSVLGTVTLSANASVTGSAAITFFPQYSLRGLWQASL